MIEVKNDRYIVFKIEDLNGMADLHPSIYPWLNAVMRWYDEYRKYCGKEEAEYIVCNQDEPYADNVMRAILEGEAAKEKENGKD